MSHEIDTIIEQGYFALYDCKHLPQNTLNWATKKLSDSEEEGLFSLRSYINQLIGYVCSCRFGAFAKVKSKKPMTLTVQETSSENPTKYVALFIVQVNEPTTISFDSKNVFIEPNMLLIIDSSLYKQIDINTKEIKLVSINIMNTLYNIIFFILLPCLALGASFESMKKEIIRAEGTAFTITRFDKGGATKYGVTKSTWFGWCGLRELQPCDRNKNGKKDDYDVALLTLNDAFLIYKKGYWDTWKGDQINDQQIAEMLCDWNINQGLGKNRRYVKLVQEILGLPKDGKITNSLINSINKADPHLFLRQVVKKRLSLYDEIIKNNPTQKRFKKSWYNRTIFILKKYEKIHSIPATISFYP